MKSHSRLGSAVGGEYGYGVPHGDKVLGLGTPPTNQEFLPSRVDRMVLKTCPGRLVHRLVATSHSL